MIIIKLHDRFKTEILSYTQDGLGVAKIDGFAMFVSGGVVGDFLLVEVTKLNKTYGFAKIIEIIMPSKERVVPSCPAFYQCGGCSLMHLSYSEQCHAKYRQIYDALSRIGGIEAPIQFNPAYSQFRYRNKMVFPFDERYNWGFYKGKSHDVVPLNDCLLGDELNQKILNCVKLFFKTQKIPIYNEATHTGILRRVFTRVSAKTSNVMVVISANADRIKKTDVLVSELTKISDRISSVILNVNKEKNNLVLGNKNITLWGDSTLSDTLCGLDFEISPNSFFQVNHEQTELLYQQVLDYADIKKHDTVLDIYCGIGTISLACAKFAKKVVGVEIVPDAIENAKENANRNGIDNAEFFCAKAEDLVPKLLDDNIQPDIVILDPPRKGSDEKTLSAICEASPRKIVYVSCNPATLARDLKFLSAEYKVESVSGFDMFPNTTSVEMVVLMSK